MALSPTDESASLLKELAISAPSESLQIFFSPAIACHKTNLPHFFPFANQPPKFLLSNSWRESTRILLLANDDVRSVLFTLQGLSTAGHDDHHLVDVTMCNQEASQIARNVLLLRLMLDSAPVELIWAIFYSWKIDSTCLQELQTCALKLLEPGPYLAAWEQSEFGKVVQICSLTSYAAVREIWAVYAQGQLDAEREKAALALRVTRRCDFLRTSRPASCVRTQPFVSAFIKNQPVHEQLEKEYFQGGATPVFIYKPVSPRAELVFNPTMLCGPEQNSTMHCCLHPPQAFDLTELYAVCDAQGRLPTAQDIYQHCFAQLVAWTAVFKSVVAKARVRLRVHVGDPLHFCQELLIPQSQSATPPLQPEVPRMFDIIDTGLLADATGLLPLLAVCGRVLTCTHDSLLHTDAVALFVGSTSLQLTLQQELCGECPTICTLLGLGLANAQWAYSTQSPTTLPYVAGYQPVALRWTKPPVAPLRFLPTEFISVLVSLYKTMFLGLVGSGPSTARAEAALDGLLVKGTRINTSLTFALVVACAAACSRGHDLQTNWLLLREIQKTGLLLQDSYVAELYVWFTELGLVPADCMETYHKDLLAEAIHPERSLQAAAFGSVPSRVLLVTMLIPWRQLASTLMQMNCSDPLVELTVRTQFVNLFSTLHMCPVRKYAPGEACDPSSLFVFTHFTVYPCTLANAEFMAFSTLVPVALLSSCNQASTRVELTLHGVEVQRMQHGHCTYYFGQDSLATAPLTDHEHVSWTKACSVFRICPPRPPCPAPPQVALIQASAFQPRLDAGRFSLLTCMVAFRGTGSLDLDESAAPGWARIRQGDACLDVALPPLFFAIGLMGALEGLPARQLLLVPMSKALPSPYLFPLTRSGAAVCLHGLPRRLLPTLPVLSIEGSPVWLSALLAAQLSPEERQSPNNYGLPRAAFKKTLQTIVATYGRRGMQGPRWATLSVDGTVELVLYIEALRLDASCGTVVLDAVLSRLTPSNRQPVLAYVKKAAGTPTAVAVSDKELELWHHLLPAFGESARLSWHHHRRHCEYGASDAGGMVLLAPVEEDATCSCFFGLGLEYTSFAAGPGYADIWKEFIRAAVPLLFEAEFFPSQGSKSSVPDAGAVPSVTGPPATGAVEPAAAASRAPPRHRHAAGSSGAKGSAATRAAAPAAVAASADPCCLKCGGRGGKLLTCGRCHTAQYCSAVCQREHWRVHKGACSA